MSTFNANEAAEVAEAAFKELLHAPTPATDREFRRIVVEAVLIGRTLEAAVTGPWQTTQPTRAGVWEMACYETEQEPERVLVKYRPGELWAEDTAVGSLPLTDYHHGLTDIRWRPAGNSKESILGQSPPPTGAGRSKPPCE